MQVQRTFKKRAGVWGIVKGDKGAASQLSPLSPLTKKKEIGISRDVSLTLNMTRLQLSLRASSASVAINKQRTPVLSFQIRLRLKNLTTQESRNISLCPATIGGAPLVALIHDSTCATEIIPPTSLQGESSLHSISPLFIIVFCSNLW